MSTCCVVLLSGGLDSATLLWKAKKELNADVYALTLIYGQKHRKEVECAKRLSTLAGVIEHRIVDLSSISWAFYASRLVEGGVEVQLSKVSRDYVPQRNLVFIALAAAWVESLVLERGYSRGLIGIAVHRYETMGYPDTRPEFVEAVSRAVALGSAAVVERKAEICVWAPFVNMTKADIIREGVRLGVPYELTWSCYRGGERPCGTCFSCTTRLRSFMEAGVPDPLTDMYEKLPEWYVQWLKVHRFSGITGGGSQQ